MIAEKGAREVFDALKRPEEHWHKWFNKVSAGGTFKACLTCNEWKSDRISNPDFSTSEGMMWIMERLTDNLDIDIEFTRAGKRYYARITNSERHWFREANNFATALYSATLAWVKEK